MAVHTPLPLPEARALARHWGLSVASVEGIPAGSVNSSYALTLDDGARVFLRLYETRSVDSAAEETRMLAHLAREGVPTPEPLPLVDDPTRCIVAYEGKPAAIFPWSEGEPVCQRAVTMAHARRVGESLARVHRAGASLRDPPPDRFALHHLAERLAKIDARGLSPALKSDVAMLVRKVEALRREPPSTPGALIHGDLFRDNVLWKDGTLSALIDFESASWGSAAFDLMVTALAWCFGDALDLGLVRAMVEGYCSVRDLSETERDELHRAARVAAVRFAVTRVTDFELRPRGAGVFKDYRRFVARLHAIEAFTESTWPEALGL
jgi:homoserine kinase type II